MGVQLLMGIHPVSHRKSDWNCHFRRYRVLTLQILSVMIICESRLKCLFMDYNEEFFEDTLPMPEIVIFHSTKNFGYFECEFYDGEVINPVIKISDRYNYKPTQLRDILVHEMLHYYLAYTGEDTKVHHGKEFIRMARSLNRTYGLHITETINDKEYTKNKDTSLFKRIIGKLF